MGRGYQRHCTQPVRLARRTNCAAPGKIRARTISCSLVRIDRNHCRLAPLASTLLIGSIVVAPTPAAAVACLQPPSPSPINTNTVGPDQAIICVNTEPRTNPAGNVINLTTNGTGSYTKPAVPSPSRTTAIFSQGPRVSSPAGVWDLRLSQRPDQRRQYRRYHCHRQ